MGTSVDVDPRIDDYPSRIDDRPRLLPRKDPVTYGAERDGPLSAAHIRRYHSHGYLLFERFFNAEELRPHLEELERLRKALGTHPRAEVITGSERDEIRAILAVHESNEVLARLCHHPRLVAIGRQLLAGDVYIHQSRVDHKSGYRGKEIYWHSDFETWHVEDGMPRMRALSCSVMLTDNHPANGPQLVIPGSHRVFLSCAAARESDDGGRPGGRKAGDPDEKLLRKMAADGGIELLAGPAGSVVFFDCNLMYASNSNITPWPRSNLFTVLNSVENALVEPYSGLAPRPQFIANRRDLSPLASA